MLPLIDDFEPFWHGTISLRAPADLVPDQPWIGRHEVAIMNVVAPGAAWIVCADLVGERLDIDQPVVAPIAPRSITRYRGRPVKPDQLSQLGRNEHPFVLIPAGTTLRAVDVFHWGDGKVPGVLGHAIEFASPDGRTIRLTTEARRDADDAAGVWRQGMTWREFACAAVVVPEEHPRATDPDACASMVARIERRARRQFILEASQ